MNRKNGRDHVCISMTYLSLTTDPTFRAENSRVYDLGPTELDGAIKTRIQLRQSRERPLVIRITIIAISYPKRSGGCLALLEQRQCHHFHNIQEQASNKTHQIL